MKEFFARLNPTERRFVVGVAVVFFLVINIVWVWPHFSDWSETRTRMDTANKKTILFEGGINLVPGLQKEIARYQGQGQLVPGENQAVQFVRLIQNQMTQFGIVAESMNPVRQTSTTNNPFFVEQAENIALQTSEKQLIDFLYSLGAGSNSLIRVKALSVQPDPSHQRLTTRLTLVASYQKKAVAPAPAGSTPAAAPKSPAAVPKTAVPDQKQVTAPPASANKPFVAPTNALRPYGSTNRMLPNPPGAVKNLTPPKK